MARVIAGIGIVLALLAAGTIGLRLWSEQGAGGDAPRIGLSVSDAWFDDLGFHRAPYDLTLARAGARVVTLRPSDHAGRIDEVLAGVDALLLAGGFDVDPDLYGGDGESAKFVDLERDRFELELLQRAETRGLPVLGICRGIQVLAVAHGGRLSRLGEFTEVVKGHGFGSGAVHEVEIEVGTKLASMVAARRPMVNSTHLCAVADSGRLRVCARSEDGVIEAIELPGDRLVLGIQWHPELQGVIDADAQRFIERFVAEARAHRR